MANSRFSLKPGKNKRPAKRLTKQQLKAEILRQEQARPIVLNEAQYEEWLEHTVLARIGRGEQSMDKVQAALRTAAKRAETQQEKQQLDLALREVDTAIVAFQYTALKFNIMYRPAINGEEALNVVLWPAKLS